jgi:hypothetical protein
MNLILSFVHVSKPAKTVGPFHSIRLDAEAVRESPAGAPVAYHRDHQWEVEGQRYFRLDATSRVRIHFERDPRRLQAIARSRGFGPFGKFSAIDGIVYTDNRVFAFVDTKVGDWFCYDDGHHWAVMVVSDASTPAKGVLATLAGLAPMLPGVIGFWQGSKLLQLGRASSIRAELSRFLNGHGPFDPQLITAATFEAHPSPAVREAELHAEYENASRTLPATYGLMHGNGVRTARLIEKAMRTVQRARSLAAAARDIRKGLTAQRPSLECCA